MTIDIKPFVDTILGKADSIKPSISPDLEQALMHRMDPARLKRQALSQGLLAFAQKLGSTPGHFLQGMGQAAPVGVGTYLNEKEKGLDTRINTLDTINKGARQDQSDALDAAQTKLKTGLSYNKYEADKSNEAAKAARDAQKHNLDMARDEAELGQVYEEMVSARLSELQQLYPEDQETVEKKIGEYTAAVKARAEQRRRRFNLDGTMGQGDIKADTAKASAGVPAGTPTKQTKDGRTVYWINGQWQFAKP